MTKEEIKQQLLQDVKQECNKIGINADFTLEEGTDWRGDKYEYIKSSSFTTTPYIFDEIHVYASLWESDLDSEDYWYLCADLHYNYTLPTGGTNGHSFGRIEYQIKNSDNTINDKFVEMPDNKNK